MWNLCLAKDSSACNFWIFLYGQFYPLWFSALQILVALHSLNFEVCPLNLLRLWDSVWTPPCLVDWKLTGHQTGARIGSPHYKGKCGDFTVEKPVRLQPGQAIRASIATVGRVDTLCPCRAAQRKPGIIPGVFLPRKHSLRLVPRNQIEGPSFKTAWIWKTEKDCGVFKSRENWSGRRQNAVCVPFWDPGPKRNRDLVGQRKNVNWGL